MSFTAITISEFINPELGSLLLLSLVFIGIASVIWWHYTESQVTLEFISLSNSIQ